LIIEAAFTEQELMHVLVDDNRINRKIVAMALDNSHVKIIEAENGEEAVKQFINNKVDMILMDCLMPVMDGFIATEKIRQLEADDQHTLILRYQRVPQV